MLRTNMKKYSFHFLFCLYTHEYSTGPSLANSGQRGVLTLITYLHNFPQNFMVQHPFITVKIQNKLFLFASVNLLYLAVRSSYSHSPVKLKAPPGSLITSQRSCLGGAFPPSFSKDATVMRLSCAH